MASTIAEIDANCLRYNLNRIKAITNHKSKILAMAYGY